MVPALADIAAPHYSGLLGLLSTAWMQDDTTGINVEAGGLVFSSRFDSGNLARVEHVAGEFQLWLSSDCAGTDKEAPYKTWFYFSVSRAEKGTTATFVLMNSNNQRNLYNNDHRPVVRCVPSSPEWVRLPSPVKTLTHPEGMRVSFSYTFQAESDTVYFAFTYPYSYTQCQEHLAHLDKEYRPRRSKSNGGSLKWPHKDVYYHRELVALSVEGRRVDLVTVSSMEGMLEELEPLFEHKSLHPHRASEPRASAFHNEKKVIILTARVHPGEVPSSFVFKGFLDFLLSNDPRARQLRRQYVFKLIPMLNPDGVVRGFYRLDTQGLNLNRYYVDPDPVKHPSIFVTRALVLQYHATYTLQAYIDLHAHSVKKGCFLYGNQLSKLEEQAATQIFAKVAALNTPYLEYGQSVFTERNMRLKDKRDTTLSKEGSGRVALYRATGGVHFYALECNYNEGTRTNAVPGVQNLPSARRADGDKGMARPLTPPSTERPGTIKYTPEVWENVGRGLAIALLDMSGTNPLSRLGGPLPARVRRRVNSGLPLTDPVVAHAPTLAQLQRSIREELLATGRYRNPPPVRDWSECVPGWKWTGPRMRLDDRADGRSSAEPWSLDQPLPRLSAANSQQKVLKRKGAGKGELEGKQDSSDGPADTENAPGGVKPSVQGTHTLRRQCHKHVARRSCSDVRTVRDRRTVLTQRSVVLRPRSVSSEELPEPPLRALAQRLSAPCHKSLLDREEAAALQTQTKPRGAQASLEDSSDKRGLQPLDVVTIREHRSAPASEPVSTTAIDVASAVPKVQSLSARLSSLYRGRKSESDVTLHRNAASKMSRRYPSEAGLS